MVLKLQSLRLWPSAPGVVKIYKQMRLKGIETNASIFQEDPVRPRKTPPAFLAKFVNLP